VPMRAVGVARASGLSGFCVVCFAVAVGGRRFWVGYLFTVHDLYDRMGLYFGFVFLEISLLFSIKSISNSFVNFTCQIL
jgi:hypothetical protein